MRARVAGGVFIESPRPLPVGTEFVCELASDELAEALQMRGRVTAVIEQDRDADGNARFGMALSYEGPGDAALERAIDKILADDATGTRAHPRVPTAYDADADHAEDTLRVQDLSEGGMRISGEATPLGGDALTRGTRVEVTLQLDDSEIRIPGHIAWAESTAAGTLFGIQFAPLPEDVLPVIRNMMRMKVIAQAIRIAVTPD